VAVLTSIILTPAILLGVANGSYPVIRDRVITMLETDKDASLTGVFIEAESNTPLHRVSYAGYTVGDSYYEWLQRMLNAGADPNLKRPNDGQTVLGEAVRGANDGALSLLLDHPNINLNLQDNGGNTALHIAAENGRTTHIARLLEKGADTTVTNAEGKTAKEKASSTDVAALFDVPAPTA